MGMTYVGNLEIVTCWCGIPHAIPEDLKRSHLNNRNTNSPTDLHCPLGHKYVIGGDSQLEAMRKARDAEFERRIREQQSHDQTRAELRETEARRRGEKAAKTRIKNRVQNGVCIHCNRTFKDLAAHMKCKHSAAINVKDPTHAQ